MRMDHWWNDTATLSTINPTGNGLESNCGFQAQRQKTRRLSHGKARVVCTEARVQSANNSFFKKNPAEKFKGRHVHPDNGLRNVQIIMWSDRQEASPYIRDRQIFPKI